MGQGVGTWADPMTGWGAYWHMAVGTRDEMLSPAESRICPFPNASGAGVEHVVPHSPSAARRQACRGEGPCAGTQGGQSQHENLGQAV